MEEDTRERLSNTSLDAPKRPPPSWLNSSMFASSSSTTSHPLMPNETASNKEDEITVAPLDEDSHSKMARQVKEAKERQQRRSIPTPVISPPEKPKAAPKKSTSQEPQEWGPRIQRAARTAPRSTPTSNATSPSGSQPPSSAFQRGLPLERRVALFQMELGRKRIQLSDLRALAMDGIPDVDNLRATTWKLLLGYLPPNRECWAAELAKKRAEYATFKEELIINPSEVARRKEEAEAAEREHLAHAGQFASDWLPLQRQDVAVEDHPLSMGPTSVWHRFFQARARFPPHPAPLFFFWDTEMVEQIDRDVKRTHPDLSFFNGQDAASLQTQEAMRRVLFIFAKLNPGIRYVQGMNEVLAPLLYVFASDSNPSHAAHAEADGFFAFVALLGDFRDNFCQQLDDSSVGIRATIAALDELLRAHDHQLWRHLHFTAKVNPQFYAFRWITLLLTQEFNFADILRLWDSLLSNTDGPMEILLRVCCSMLVCLRARLLAGDFTTDLKLLQNYPPTDIGVILQTAEQFKS
eukprot:jgi/Mesen1/6504/ME000332S05508